MTTFQNLLYYMLVGLLLHRLHIKQMIVGSGQKYRQYYVLQFLPEETSSAITYCSQEQKQPYHASTEPGCQH